MPRHFALAFLIASATTAAAMSLENVRVEATLTTSPRDPFRIRGRIAGVDASAVSAGPLSLRFASLQAEIPAGGFRRRGRSTFTWRSYVLGVKKVTVNVKKATIDVVGGGSELGDLPGPVTLALAMPSAVTCGRVVWNAQVTLPARGGRRGVRKMATGPLGSCVATDGADHTPPQLMITSPTSLTGTTTVASTITLGGIAVDDVAVAGLAWSSDRGGGASVVPASAWTIADLPVSAGDNRITVSATDAAGNTGTDVLDVTVNANGLVFDGPPIAEPDAFFVGDLTRAEVRQTIEANPDLDPASITLVRLEADGTTTDVGALTDDGNLDTGDKIEADGVYTGEVRVRATGVGFTHYRVAARTLSQPDVVAWSPILTVPTVTHVPQQDLQAAIDLASDARTLVDNLVAGGTSAADAAGEAVALAFAHGAGAAGLSAGGLGAWWVDENGLLGGVLAYDQTAQRGGGAAAGARTVRAPSAITGGDSTQVGSRRSLILAPYFSDAEPAAVDTMLRGSTCPEFSVDTRLGEQAGAEQFKSLEQYGVVVVASHGDALFDAVGDAYRSEWGWSSTGAQTVVLTGTTLTATNRYLWERDLRLGRMAVFPAGVAGILPTFFQRYSVRLPSTLVYVGSCRSAANPTLSSALFEIGASAMFGYDGYVSSAFATSAGSALFTNLLAGKSASDAFTPGDNDGGSPPASLVLAGDVGLTGDPVINGSFEILSGFEASVTGFAVHGDGRIVGSLGSTFPTDGTRMAIVSTGLGLTTQSGSFAQPVCMPFLPLGATKLMLYYDWNFFSEEFLEYCGSPYQDSFEVKFGDNSLQSTKVDDLCGSVTPADVSFDKGGVYKTGWLGQAIDVTAFAGQTADLSFAAKDVGDSIYDTAILVDHVRIVAE